MDNSAVTVLRKARALLAKRGGWIRGEAWNGRGGYCVLGALNRAAKTEDTEWDSGLYLSYAIGVLLPENLAKWNDDPRRTKRQVLNAFTKAIALAKRASGRAK